MSRTNRRPGWTVIELLVVIAILGTLAGITIPAVQAVRKAADETKRVNWLDQRKNGVTLQDRKAPISILFIGNSLTQNGDADLPQILQSLARQSGKIPAL